MMKYRRTAFWIAGLLLVACIILATYILISQNKNPKTHSWPKLEDTIENYTAEQAATDGCVVIDNRTLLAGEKEWADFVNKSAGGNKAAVRIYQSYSEQGDSYWVNELRYDGKRYVLSFYERAEDTGEITLYKEEFKYLNRSISTMDVQRGLPTTEYYLLSDSEEATAEGYLSSMLTARICPENEIYNTNKCNLIYSCEVKDEYELIAEYGVAFVDVDGDGITEKCCLGMGRTSGLFTFTLATYENDKQEHFSVFETEHYNPLRFVQDKDGKLQIKGISPNNPSEAHIYDIGLRDGVMTIYTKESEIQPIN